MRGLLWPRLRTAGRLLNVNSRIPSGGKRVYSEQPRRNPDFGSITDADIARFEIIIPKRVITSPEVLDSANVDWMVSCRGNSKVLLKPKSTQEVSDILALCSERHLAVVPQGGNTGLVGGGVPVHDEVILSSQLMDSIISVDETTGVLVCQAGCVLERLETYLSDVNLIPPYDLGAKGSCHIGGNVATNAGGLRFLRYGSLHGNVLGLEVVLADGKVLDLMSVLRKDNTGYDMKQLFIGSEGSLGFITTVSLLCPRKPTSINVAFLAVTSFEDVVKLLKSAKSGLGEILSAFEFIDMSAMEGVETYLELKDPLRDCSNRLYNFYVLIETHGFHSDHDSRRLDDWLADSMNSGLVENGTVAADYRQMLSLWQFRERISEAVKHEGRVAKYDISLSLESYYRVVTATRERFGGSVHRVTGYGHVGDGNLHLNVVTDESARDLRDDLDKFVMEWVREAKGSISAEHGIGLHKRGYLHYSKSSTAIHLMKDIKKLFDPTGILNPYKLFI